MNPAQLLNPKAFAKEKAKAKKKTPNYGPQQSRKPKPSEETSTAPKFPTYDPKALLNPKAGGGKSASVGMANNTPGAISAATNAPVELNDAVNGPSMSNMLGRHHNLTNREAPLQNKRKSDVDGDEQDHKKTKSTFVGGGSGGTISENMRVQREKLAAAQGPDAGTIDLTDEVEPKQDDDDVVFVGESNNEEVCIGAIRIDITAYQVPHLPKGSLGKDTWRPADIGMSQSTTQNNIIEFKDRKGEKFGRLSYLQATVLVPFFNTSSVSRVRGRARLMHRARKPNEEPGQPISEMLKGWMVLYTARKRVEWFGKYLSQKQLFLESPQFLLTGTKEIVNPHAMPQNWRENVASAVKKATMPQGQPNYVSRTTEEQMREVHSMFDSFVNHEDLPHREIDDSIIVTPLMDHQKQALHFLHEHEHVDFDRTTPKFSLWKQQQKPNGVQFWYNVITGQEISKTPAPTQGGILADVMGLGKTLSILSLIASTHSEAKQFRRDEVPSDMTGIERNVKSTLIVCPKSVLTNWQEQIQMHTRPDKLKVYVYHGSSRLRDVEELGKFDIVLTSYGTVASDVGGGTKNKALGKVQWFRVVLDEAHTIRNAGTRSSKSCCLLEAQRRWAVTGTPIQNRLDDLGALIKFVRIKPFDDPAIWAQFVMAPFKHANPDVITHLRLIVDSVTLRRGKQNIDLKARQLMTERLDFSDTEQRLYSLFASQSNLKLKSMLRDSNVIRGKSYAHVLRSLLRLRQICCHGREMLNEEDLREIEGLDAGHAIELGDEPDLDADTPIMSDRQAYEVLQMQADNDMNRCMKCNNSIALKRPGNQDPYATSDEDTSDDDDEDGSDGAKAIGYFTPCYHLLCTNCKPDYERELAPKVTVDGYHYCPNDNSYLRYGFFTLTRQGLEAYDFEKTNRVKGKKVAMWNSDSYSGPHTKVKALLHHLRNSVLETDQLPEDEPPIRSVVFSEWTSYLDLIEYALEKEGFGFVRLDGTMNVKQRSQVLARFKSDPTISILLVSIRAGGQGLNFTAANKVYMMEPQFNPGIEQQAIDRVHRLGQTREVEIVRFIMRESVEEGLLKLQEKKLKLAEMSMEKKRTRGEDAKKRIEELRELFK